MASHINSVNANPNTGPARGRSTIDLTESDDNGGYSSYALQKEDEALPFRRNIIEYRTRSARTIRACGPSTNSILRRTLSILESLPLEIQTMILRRVQPADSLSLKLVSKTINAALKLPSGRDTIPGASSMSGRERWERHRAIEAKWHRPQLSVLCCSQCFFVKSRDNFPNGYRARKLMSRRICVHCGFYGPRPNLSWRTTGVSVDARKLRMCGACELVTDASAIEHSPGTDTIFRNRLADRCSYICTECAGYEQDVEALVTRFLVGTRGRRRRTAIAREEARASTLPNTEA